MGEFNDTHDLALHLQSLNIIHNHNTNKKDIYTYRLTYFGRKFRDSLNTELRLGLN